MIERVSLPVDVCRRLAEFLGREELPALCVDELGACLSSHLHAASVERDRKNKATAGTVEASIARACKSLEELVALDSGIDSESLRILRPHAKAFITAGRDRIADLMRFPRVHPYRELLRMTCPRLKSIFLKHVQPEFNTRGNLRNFALCALSTAGIETPGVDESRLNRLDEFLEASVGS